MSISIRVAACREITDDDRSLITIYNGLVEHNIDPPDDLVHKLNSILGDGAFDVGDTLSISDPAPGTVKTVELLVRGEGDVMYGDGMLIYMSDLPPNTVALRIYSEA